MRICVPHSRCNLTLTAWLEIADRHLIPEITPVLEERRRGLGPNGSIRGAKKHHEPQRVPFQVAMRCQTIGETQRSCGLQPEFRACHGENIPHARGGMREKFEKLLSFAMALGVDLRNQRSQTTPGTFFPAPVDPKAFQGPSTNPSPSL